MKKILVTGGAGYIGSHVVIALMDAGFRPLVLDNLVHGHKELVEALGAEVIVGDVGDARLLNQIFKQRDITAVMHFAAYAYVGESVEFPAKYYLNNVAAPAVLLDCMVTAGINNFIFSSTCATYGLPQNLPISEETHQRPINPYGQSKLMVEKMLHDFRHAYGLNYVIFRYFNAAGADPGGRVGERHSPETHLIPLVLQTALGYRDAIKVFGDDYPTSDGSCIRDYIHVLDLADAHVRGLNYLERGDVSDVFNLGVGRGYSVFEVINAAREITGKEIPVEISPRRAGDPPALYANAEKAGRVLGWKPQYSEIRTIIEHAWKWHKKESIR